MSILKKRSYNTKNRHAKAVQTRQKILTAAQELFQKNGFESSTIEQIANASGVSCPTIYALFQSKKGVLRALLDSALPSTDYENLVKSVHESPCARQRLLLAAKISRQLYDAEKSLMDLFRGAHVLSPEFREVERERENRRYERQSRSVQRMVTEEILPKGMDLKHARDILWVFTGRDLYHNLVIEKGWSSDDYEAWLGAFLGKIFLEKEDS